MNELRKTLVHGLSDDKRGVMLVTKGGEKGGITSSDGSMTYFTQAHRHSELELFAAVKGLEENGFISSLNSELKFKELGEIPATRSPIENVY